MIQRFLAWLLPIDLGTLDDVFFLYTTWPSLWMQMQVHRDMKPAGKMGIFYVCTSESMPKRMMVMQGARNR